MNEDSYEMLLVEERNKWRQQLKDGTFLWPYFMDVYRKNRNSNLWRASREIEKLCEIILFMEEYIVNNTKPVTLELPSALEPRIKLNDEFLSTLLRINLSSHIGKSLTHEVLSDITKQIIESLEFFLNKNS